MTESNDNLHRALVGYGRMLVQKYKAQLRIDRTNATGDTADSIDYSINNDELTILSDLALKYIDEGRGPGGQPAYSEIAEWARAKGIKPRGADGEFIKSTRITEFWMVRNIAKAIASNGTIKRFGYGGSGIIEFVYGRNKNEISDGLFLEYGKDVDTMIKQIVKA